MKRYFIVFFTGKDGINGQFLGECTFTSEGYLNRKSAHEYILSKNREGATCVLTNIIEITEQDYIDYKS